MPQNIIERPTPAVATPVTDEAIRERAYFIWQERGMIGGDPSADWLQAERELRAQFDR